MYSGVKWWVNMTSWETSAVPDTGGALLLLHSRILTIKKTARRLFELCLSTSGGTHTAILRRILPKYYKKKKEDNNRYLVNSEIS